jgi:hypothetical protein
MKTTKNTKKQYYIAEWYKTPEEIEERKQKIDKDMKLVLSAIKKGKIYAKIESVSRSGMSRRISFYMVINNRIERVTSQIAWLAGYETPGYYNYKVIDNGLQVSGCGMDMIFATLYNCMPYKQARKWNQQYNIL